MPGTTKLGFAGFLLGAVVVLHSGAWSDSPKSYAGEPVRRLVYTIQGLPGGHFQDMELVDLDGDGDLDAFAANGHSSPNLVFMNQGGTQGGTPGVFADSGQTLGDSSSHGVALGDVDGDEDLDAFVANNYTQPNTVWLNNGSGTFTDSGQALGTGYSTAVALADLDGDGDLDAFVTNEGSNANRVWLNQGGDQGGLHGLFVDSGQSLGDSDSRDVALGDVDLDGDLDAFVANLGGANMVWLNDGSAGFSSSGQSLGSAPSRGVALGDLDGDGDLDAFTTNAGTHTGAANTVWLNQGGAQSGILGFYLDSGQTLGERESYGIALADFDGDGDLDAVVANQDYEPNVVWENDGAGAFSETEERLYGYRTNTVAVGDLDGDGHLDVFSANDSLERCVVWLSRMLVLQESFVSFPPPGWGRYETGAPDDPGWVTSNTGGWDCARHDIVDTTGNAISWLVSATVTLPPNATAATLQFFETTNALGGPYYYNSVWISTGNADPEQGDYTELAGLGEPEPYEWVPVQVDATAYAGQTVHFAFRYEGDDAHPWYVDEVTVLVDVPETGAVHTADQNADNQISLSELLRVIQFYNSGGLHCEAGTEDGYAAGAGADHACATHACDYNPHDWEISLSELLRLIQFYNSGAYHACAEGEDGYCPGPA